MCDQMVHTQASGPNLRTWNQSDTREWIRKKCIGKNVRHSIGNQPVDLKANLWIRLEKLKLDQKFFFYRLALNFVNYQNVLLQTNRDIEFCVGVWDTSIFCRFLNYQ